MDAVKQVNSGKEAGIKLASGSLKRKAENPDLSNSIKIRDEATERGLEQVDKNDSSDVVSGDRNIYRMFLGSKSSAGYYYYHCTLHIGRVFDCS